MVATATCLGHSRGISATIPPVNRRKGTVDGWAGMVGLMASWAEAQRGRGDFFVFTYLSFSYFIYSLLFKFYSLILILKYRNSS